ncbi:lysine--tRNA ligase [Emcibacter sp.]|uniref:lysine--tRNA ligase n=1 Tax=Emcibacter sp. TaxID=1979954 RepID=UPI003A95DDC7
MTASPEVIAQALESKAWPFQEAEKLVKRLEKTGNKKGHVLFETGYGPSGLPHIGTFGEVARTTMVRKAFELISDVPTRLIAFSDDMDGFRKVPSNLPNQDMLQDYLGLPLTKVPDPFGTHESFAHHNNDRLCKFLDSFGFEYEFKSATEAYTSGEMDDTLLKMLANYDRIMKVMLPTLGEERQKTYSPFLPVCPRTGRVLQVPLVERNVEAGTIVYKDEETGELVEVPVTGGHCKAQWKADWAMRWVALDVDYEMSGKDLYESVKLSSIIARILGSEPPEGFNYELFLDENGQKISKSKGNGLTMEEWLQYGTPESLALYMYQAPRKAKKLYFDVIPKAVDDYLTFLSKFRDQEGKEKFANPIWHIHGDTPPAEDVPVTFSLLLNLVSASNAHDKETLWGYINAYAPEASGKEHPLLDQLVGYALVFYENFVKPTKKYRAPTEEETGALLDLITELENLPENAEASDYQTAVFTVGKAHNYENLREWFQALYEILLGQQQGPRMGSFIALYGRAETIGLIRQTIGK